MGTWVTTMGHPLKKNWLSSLSIHQLPMAPLIKGGFHFSLSSMLAWMCVGWYPATTASGSSWPQLPCYARKTLVHSLSDLWLWCFFFLYFAVLFRLCGWKLYGTDVLFKAGQATVTFCQLPWASIQGFACTQWEGQCEYSYLTLLVRRTLTLYNLIYCF